MVTLSQFLAQAKGSILDEHWQSLALNQDKVPLDPQWDVYYQRESQGELLIMGLYAENDELAGYFIGFIAPGLHYSTCLTCTMDIFFIREKFRGNLMLARKLFRSVELELRSRGVSRWFVGTKLHKDVGRLFEALRFTPVEMYYSKWLGD